MNATLQRIAREAGIAIGLTIAVGLVGYSMFGGKLKAAEDAAKAADNRAADASADAKTAWIVAGAALRAKDAAEARADTAAKAAMHSKVALAVAAARFDSLGKAPDTCQKWVAAATGARDLANETAQHWKEAYDAQVEATGKLQGAIDTVKAADDSLIPATDSAVAASRRLAKAIRPSFGHRFLVAIKPKINIDAVTFDPRTGAVEAGPKVGLGWSISL